MTSHATTCQPRQATCKPPADSDCWPRGSIEIIGESRAFEGGPVTHFIVATVIDPDRPHRVPARYVHERPLPAPCLLTDFLVRRAAGERGDSA